MEDRSGPALPAVQNGVCPYKVKPWRVPLAETELASQPDRQHDKIAPKPKAPSKMKVSSNNTTINGFFKASNAPVDPPQVEKVTVKLHAGHSAADGNRAVTSEVNRPAIVTIAAARRQRTPSWKSWVTQGQDSKMGKKLFLAKGLAVGDIWPPQICLKFFFGGRHIDS